MEGHLDELWGPEQSSFHWRQKFPNQFDRNACPVTIYQALYRPGDGIPRALLRKLQTGRSLRHRQRRPDRRTTRFVSAIRSSYDRSIEVTDRQQPGHSEGDLMNGTKNRSAIGTRVEKTSRYALLVHLHDDKSADSVMTGIIKALRGLPEHMRLRLTWDRGMEMAEHARIATSLRMPVVFWQPMSLLPRGTNENTNG